jgi:hypothetical protein
VAEQRPTLILCSVPTTMDMPEVSFPLIIDSGCAGNTVSPDLTVYLVHRTAINPIVLFIQNDLPELDRAF